MCLCECMWIFEFVCSYIWMWYTYLYFWQTKYYTEIYNIFTLMFLKYDDIIRNVENHHPLSPNNLDLGTQNLLCSWEYLTKKKWFSISTIYASIFYKSNVLFGKMFTLCLKLRTFMRIQLSVVNFVFFDWISTLKTCMQNVFLKYNLDHLKNFAHEFWITLYFLFVSITSTENVKCILEKTLNNNKKNPLYFSSYSM